MVDELTTALIALNLFQLGVLFVMNRRITTVEAQNKFISQQLEYSVNWKKKRA